jgi:hypothetical protein
MFILVENLALVQSNTIIFACKNGLFCSFQNKQKVSPLAGLSSFGKPWCFFTFFGKECAFSHSLAKNLLFHILSWAKNIKNEFLRSYNGTKFLNSQNCTIG